jgi:hypothetical protein
LGIRRNEYVTCLKKKRIFHMFFHLLPFTTPLLLAKSLAACILALLCYFPFHCILSQGSLASVILPRFHDTKSRIFWINKHSIPGRKALINKHPMHSEYISWSAILPEYKSADGPHTRHVHDSGFHSNGECINDYMRLKNLPYFPIRTGCLLPSIFGLVMLQTNNCCPAATLHTYNHKCYLIARDRRSTN